MLPCRRSLPLFTLCLLFAVCCPGVVAQTESSEEKSSDQKMIEAKRQARMQTLAESHEVLVGDSGEKAKLLKTSIFSWANPERSSIGGALHMWTLKGRPIATIGLWTYTDTKDSYEYQSLYEGPLNVSSGAGEAWQPGTPGVKYLPIPDCDAPARTPQLRLVQLRKIARDRFTSYSDDDEQLRLLPQPIYRYDEFPDNVIDGAIFSFAEGTDPETLVIFEARLVENTKQWFYAFASQTSGGVDGRLDGKAVWDNSELGDSFRIHLFRGQ
jgi:hypothetical protein